jgi:hypothetical protein
MNIQTWYSTNGEVRKRPGQRGDLQVKIERLGGIQVDKLLRHAVSPESVHDGALHDVVDLLHLPPAGDKSHSHGCNGVNQPAAQFFEVIEKAHGGHSVALRLAARSLGRSFKHASPAVP